MEKIPINQRVTDDGDSHFDKWKALLAKSGMKTFEDEFEDGEPHKPVDEELLRKFFQGQLNPSEEEDVAKLIARYRQWYDSSNVVTKKLDNEENSA